MIWPPVLVESTGVVFVSFALRTVDAANVNENTALMKRRMVAE